jgi:hypothetical protein
MRNLLRLHTLEVFSHTRSRLVLHHLPLMLLVLAVEFTQAELVQPVQVVEC